MEHETKILSLSDFKAEGDAGTFEGYASIFGNTDLGGDVVVKGAFTKTLAENGGKFPLLTDHGYTMGNRVGIVEAREDNRGLRVKGFFNLDKQVARETYSDLKHAAQHGVPVGMSFGYAAVEAEHDRKRGARLLKEVRLYEVTLTQFPMNPAAGVTAVKHGVGTQEERELLAALQRINREVKEDGEARQLREVLTALQRINREVKATPAQRSLTPAEHRAAEALLSSLRRINREANATLARR